MNKKKTAALDKKTCTDLVDFGKNEDRLGKVFGSQKEGNDNK